MNVALILTNCSAPLWFGKSPEMSPKSHLGIQGRIGEVFVSSSEPRLSMRCTSCTSSVGITGAALDGLPGRCPGGCTTCTNCTNNCERSSGIDAATPTRSPSTSQSVLIIGVIGAGGERWSEARGDGRLSILQHLECGLVHRWCSWCTNPSRRVLDFPKYNSLLGWEGERHRRHTPSEVSGVLLGPPDSTSTAFWLVLAPHGPHGPRLAVPTGTALSLPVHLVRRPRSIHPRAYARGRRPTVLILASPLGAPVDRQQRHVVDRLRARCPTTPAMTSTSVELAPSSDGPRKPRLGGRPRARVTAVVTRAHSPNAAITCAGYRPVFFFPSG